MINSNSTYPNNEIGRRYLRFFKFIEIFDSAVTVLSPATSAVVGRNGTSSTLLRLLEFAKLNCLGIYFFLESLTIVRPPYFLVSVRLAKTIKN